MYLQLYEKQIENVNHKKQGNDQRGIMEAAGKRYDRLQALNDGRNFYDHEKEFINILEDLGREVFEKNINTVSPDRRKKTRCLLRANSDQ